MELSIDREKMIRAIESCYTLGHNCTECPLFLEDDCNDKLMHDVLDLLKEQEAIPPVRYSDGDPGELASWWYVCGACGRGLDYHDRYCRWCGKKAKWE